MRISGEEKEGRSVASLDCASRIGIRQGSDLLEWCGANGLAHVNSFFQHKRRGTWCSNFNGKWYELDGFLMSNEQRRKHVRKIHSVGEATISDHKPKRMVLDLKQKAWRRIYQGKKTPRINFLKLREEGKQNEYKRKVEEKIREMEEGG